MKKVVFVCTHNSCRSQIAEALGKHLAGDVFECYSAGTHTKSQLNQDVVRIMKEIYKIDMEKTQYPKLLSKIPKPDIIISMGCEADCPFTGREYDDNWSLEDPTGKSDQEYIRIIKEIERKILELLVKELFSSGYNCSQIVASFFAEKYGMKAEQVKRLSCGFGGGMRKAEVCGAVTGGIMAIGMKYGNAQADDTAAKMECYKQTEDFENAFQEKEGSILCRELLDCNIATAEGMEYAKNNNLFPTICPKMIVSAIQILREMQKR